MTNELEQSFDYRELQPDDRGFVKERAVAIRKTAQATAELIVCMGQWFTEVKERLPHGQWLRWLGSEIHCSDDTARRFMQVWQCVKNRNVRNLESFDISALYLIAAPKTPEPVKAEILRRAQNGEHITPSKARECLHQFAEEQKRQEARTVLQHRAKAALSILAQLVEDYRKEFEAQQDDNEKACRVVWAVLTFWQTIDVLRHPYLDFKAASMLGFREDKVQSCDEAQWQVFKEAFAFDSSGMDMWEQLNIAMPRLAEMATTISPCVVRECLSRTSSAEFAAAR